jgi:hypothetical protein
VSGIVGCGLLAGHTPSRACTSFQTIAGSGLERSAGYRWTRCCERSTPVAVALALAFVLTLPTGVTGLAWARLAAERCETATR